MWALPMLLIGGGAYPLTQLRTAVMYVAVASLIGLTVHAGRCLAGRPATSQPSRGRPLRFVRRRRAQ